METALHYLRLDKQPVETSWTTPMATLTFCFHKTQMNACISNPLIDYKNTLCTFSSL